MVRRMISVERAVLYLAAPFPPPRTEPLYYPTSNTSEFRFRTAGICISDPSVYSGDLSSPLTYLPLCIEEDISVVRSL